MARRSVDCSEPSQYEGSPVGAPQIHSPLIVSQRLSGICHQCFDRPGFGSIRSKPDRLLGGFLHAALDRLWSQYSVDCQGHIDDGDSDPRTDVFGVGLGRRLEVLQSTLEPPSCRLCQ